MRWWPWLGIGLVACGDKVDVDSDAPGPATHTWYRDVAPVLEQTCVRCHNGEGLGPGDFTNPATAQAYAPAMIARIDAGEMPPPAADPDCNDFEGSARFTLADGGRDAIQGWIDSDFALGDPSTKPTLDLEPIPTLTRRDLELHTQAPYTPNFVDGNEYRCFILDVDATTNLFVSGFEPIIDEAAISHHTLFFVDPTGTADAYVTDPETRSWHCPQTIPDGDWLLLHAWAPGNNPVEFPDGYSMIIPAGSQLVLQMHYYDSGEEVQDSPGYWLKTEPTMPDQQHSMYFIPLGPDDFVIPAGEAAFEVTDVTELEYGLPVPLTTTVYGVFPHMHVLGSGYEFAATTPDGEEKCIARADAYDFANQPTYWFEEPIVLAEGSTSTVTCRYDNSAANPAQPNDPPVDVYWGEDTNEEMCFALYYATVSP